MLKWQNSRKLKKIPIVIEVEKAKGTQEEKKSDWPQSLEVLEQYL